MYCGKCGALIETGETICPNCGAKVENANQSLTGETPAAQAPKNFVEKLRQQFTTPQLVAICAGIVAVIAAAIIIPIVAIHQNDSDDTVSTTSNSTSSNAADTTQEATTEDIDIDGYAFNSDIDLSGEYDMVLAESPAEQKRRHEPFYQFVVKQEQTSSKIVTKVGVIKNKSEWLVPLTDEHPFLDKEKNTISGSVYDNMSGQEGGTITYLDNGCFLGTRSYTDDSDYSYYHHKEPWIVYNSETGKYVDLKKYADGECDSFTAQYENKNMNTYSDSEDPTYIYDGKLIFSFTHDRDDRGDVLYDDADKSSCKAYSQIYYLDLNTMKVQSIFRKDYKIVEKKYYAQTRYDFNEYEVLGNYSEGLFLMSDYFNDGTMSYVFYNLKGEAKLNLASYVKKYGNITLVDTYFMDDQFRFRVQNDLGNTFEITINKKGEEVSNEPVS